MLKGRMYQSPTPSRGVPRIFGGGGGEVPRSAKQANKPNKRATELKPRTCMRPSGVNV